MSRDIANSKLRPTPFVYTHQQMLCLLGLTESSYRNNAHVIAPRMRRYHSGLWDADDVESLARRLRFYKNRVTHIVRCRFPPDVLDDIYAAGRRLGIPAAPIVRLLAHEGVEIGQQPTISANAPNAQWKTFFLRVPERLSDLSRMVSGEDIAARAVSKMALAGYTAHGLADDADIAERLDAHPLAVLTWVYADVMKLPEPPADVRLPLETPLPLPPVYSVTQVGKLLRVDLGNMSRAGLYPRDIPWVRCYPVTKNNRCVYDAIDIDALVDIFERHRARNGRLKWGDLAKEVLGVPVWQWPSV